MDILFILIPLSVGLALLILGALGWAVWRGQFEGVDAEGERILRLRLTFINSAPSDPPGKLGGSR